MVSVVALVVRVAIALSVDFAAAAVAVAARALSVASMAVVAARVAVDTEADIAEAADATDENASQRRFSGSGSPGSRCEEPLRWLRSDRRH
jgi:hypothetical protein